MSSTNIKVRVDKEIKEKAQSIFEDLGMNMSTGINIFLAAVLREEGIPFQLNIHTASPVKEGVGVLEEKLDPYRIEKAIEKNREILERLVDL
ncbi:type II toxin-antitoxin system RelB/DinJ family antitoxin [Hutsoniella sourekii]